MGDRATTANPRRIIVHLGFPKTGSTTIQKMLEINAERLGPGIVASPKDDLTYRLRKYALRYKRTGVVVWKWLHSRAMAEMRRQIDAMDFETLIISDENMISIESGKLFLPDIGSHYLPWLQGLDTALDGYDVTYVVYTRDVKGWQRSSYNQAFRMRRVFSTYADWAQEHDNLDGPEQIIAGFRGICGDRLHVIDMKTDGAGGLLGAAILRLAGVAPDVIDGLAPPPRENESLPLAGIELLRHVRATPGIRRWHYRALVRLFRKHPELFAPDKRD